MTILGVILALLLLGVHGAAVYLLWRIFLAMPPDLRYPRRRNRAEDDWKV